MDTRSVWINRAALFEILSYCFRLPTNQTGEVLVCGEFSEAFLEIGEANGFTDIELKNLHEHLNSYHNRNSDVTFHQIRSEYTRLFVGAPSPAVSPYAGVWWAEAHGIEPMMFVSTRSLEIEHFMKSYGVGNSHDANIPLDHISTILEFLQYCSLELSDVAYQERAEKFGQSQNNTSWVISTETHFAIKVSRTSTPLTITPEVIEEFKTMFLFEWLSPFIERLLATTAEPLYSMAAQALNKAVHISSQNSAAAIQQPF